VNERLSRMDECVNDKQRAHESGTLKYQEEVSKKVGG
jgi:hypothetical protein